MSATGSALRKARCELRLVVECRACHGRVTWSQLFSDFATVESLSRNLARLAVGDISTIWQMEVRSTGAGRSIAFPTWADSEHMNARAVLQSASGPDSAAQ